MRCRTIAMLVVYERTAMPGKSMRIGRLAGIPIGINPPSRRTSTLARDLVESDPDLFVDEDADVVELLERPGFQRIGRAVVLTDRGGVGILSITEVQRAVRASRLAPDGPGPTVPVAH